MPFHQALVNLQNKKQPHHDINKEIPKKSWATDVICHILVIIVSATSLVPKTWQAELLAVALSIGHRWLVLVDGNF